MYLFSDTLIKSGVVEHYDSVFSLLANWQSQLAQHSSRLLLVREEKAKRLEEEGGMLQDTHIIRAKYGCSFYILDELPPHPDCDMFSDTSSIGGSTKSRSSSGSSRGTGYVFSIYLITEFVLIAFIFLQQNIQI
jgi:hypothetical protein